MFLAEVYTTVNSFYLNEYLPKFKIQLIQTGKEYQHHLDTMILYHSQEIFQEKKSQKFPIW